MDNVVAALHCQGMFAVGLGELGRFGGGEQPCLLWEEFLFLGIISSLRHKGCSCHSWGAAGFRGVAVTDELHRRAHLAHLAHVL